MSPHELTMLKAAVPFLHPGIQPGVRLFLCLQELRTVMNGAKKTPPITNHEPLIQHTDELLQKLTPYCNAKEKNMLEQVQMMENMLQLFRFYQESGTTAGSSEPADLLQAMLSPEQQETFSMMRTIMEASEGLNANHASYNKENPSGEPL